jgi:transcriptional regulator with XRE-family HTH domain
MTTKRTLDDMLAARPVDRAAVEQAKGAMLGEVRLHRLRELRRDAPGGALNQQQLAELLHVSQTRVSRIERGDLARTEIGTLRRYVEALGGRLVIDVEVADTRYQIA